MFYTPESAETLDLAQFDAIADCIDTVKAKVTLVCRAKEAGVYAISAMGAGNKLDPTRFQVTDIAKTSVCPLCRVMRVQLKKRGVAHHTVVYSTEEPLKVVADESNGRHAPGQRQLCAAGRRADYGGRNHQNHREGGSMMQGAVAREEVELSFKRYILEKTEAFAHEPMEDLYRVNLLGQMLDRYDELQKKGLSADAALQRTLADYADIPAQMRREGFEEAGARRTEARWPQLTEEEAADYVKQSNAYTHKIAMGSALCSACVAPMMLLVALMSIYNRQDVGGMLGCVGMFGMIGMGIYCLVTAKKPKNRDQIRNGRFSLSAALRKKLMKLKELTDEKSRRKKGMGSTLLATCCVPIFIGAALDSMWYVYNNSFAILGVGAMFLMIGAGVYEVVVASGEKKPLKDLLKE